MSWGEAGRLILILRSDPGTQLAAAVEKWDYPWPREVAAIADLFDLQYAKTGARNRKPYTRPFESDREKRRRGNTAGRSRAEVIEILRASGHNLPV